MLSIVFGVKKRENESWILGDEEEVQERMSQSEMCCRNKEVMGNFILNSDLKRRRKKTSEKLYAVKHYWPITETLTQLYHKLVIVAQPFVSLA
jgi:hypothetical protein